MDYDELYVKYQALLDENIDLKTEIKSLNARLGISGRQKDVIDEIDTGSYLDQISDQYNNSEELNSNHSLWKNSCGS